MMKDILNDIRSITCKLYYSTYATNTTGGERINNNNNNYTTNKSNTYSVDDNSS